MICKKLSMFPCPTSVRRPVVVVLRRPPVFAKPDLAIDREYPHLAFNSSQPKAWERRTAEFQGLKVPKLVLCVMFGSSRDTRTIDTEVTDDRLAHYRSQQAERGTFPSGIGYFYTLSCDFDGCGSTRKAALMRKGIPFYGVPFSTQLRANRRLDPADRR